jgi:Xaa-Pro aminopeptidase
VAAEHAGRVAALTAAAADAGYDLLYVGHSTDLEYLIGLQRPEPHYGQTRFFAQWAMGAVFIAGAKPTLLVPRHVAEFHLGRVTAEPGLFDVQVITESDDPGRVVVETTYRMLGATPRSIGVNQDAPAELVLGLQAAYPAARVAIADRLIKRLRSLKSPMELAALKRGCLLADQVFAESLQHITPALTEIELGRWIEERLDALGVVTSSANAAIFCMGDQEMRSAAERISTRPIGRDICVNYDFGACLDGYCMDFGRTVYVGSPSARVRAAYEAVIAAQDAGANALRPGARCADVDRAARREIELAGFGEYFRHRLGHGIGMDVHEAPYLDSTESTLVEEDQTFTIEPSVFITGELGVRIEDIYIATPSGGVRLNAAGRSLLTL